MQRDNLSIERYKAEISKVSQLKPEEEKALSDQIKQGVAAAVDRLVTANLRLVMAVAGRYRNRGVSYDDLVSEGNIGLMKAAIKFDADKGRFASFAVPIISQTIEQAIAKQSSLYTVPETGMGHARMRHVRPLSVDAPLGGRGNNVNLLSFLSDSEAVASDDLLEKKAVSAELNGALAVLDEREREVVTRCYGLGTDKQTMAEIGERMGLKRERVRQIRTKALRKISRALRHGKR